MSKYKYNLWEYNIFSKSGNMLARFIGNTYFFHIKNSNDHYTTKQAFNVGLCYTIFGDHFVTLSHKAYTCTKVLVAILNVIFIKFQMTIIRLKQAFNVGLCSIIIGNHFLPLFCKAYTCTKVLVATLNVIFMKFEIRSLYDLNKLLTFSITSNIA